MKRASLTVGTTHAQELTTIVVVPSQPLNVCELEALIVEQFALPVIIQQRDDKLLVTFPVGLKAMRLNGDARQLINGKWVFDLLVSIEEDMMEAQEVQERTARLLALPVNDE